MGLGFAGMSRRQFMGVLGAAGGLAALDAMAGPVIERAFAADPGGSGSLNDIEHFVFLMQENRSFDHYFGTMSSVRGYGDPTGQFNQYGFNAATGKADASSFINPFHLDTSKPLSNDGECITDPTHDWGPQHQAWNGGRMDQWVQVHVANDGVGAGPATMGYYTQQDIPYHWALADAFTVCDHYFCSVMGPTDPNRLYWISATIDPDGENGGPLLTTPTTLPKNVYSWKTFPEALQDAGVTWKFYADKTFPVVSDAVLSSGLVSFKNFQDKNSELYKRGIAPSFPNDLMTDVKNNTLPSVSWIIPNLLQCEHPALPPAFGAQGIIHLLDILTSNPAVWEKTALIISYDENGGFFDHVAPPTAPEGTPGEYVTVPLGGVDGADGIRGPIGLGFRVPGLVISPYSRGGLVSSEVFDHTSQLKLIETRFGVEVPNLSAWRRETVGDMTSAFNFAAAPQSKFTLEATSENNVKALLECKVGIDTVSGTFLSGKLGGNYPPPKGTSVPAQDTTPVRGTPSGPVTATATTAAKTTAAKNTAAKAKTATTKAAAAPAVAKAKPKPKPKAVAHHAPVKVKKAKQSGKTRVAASAHRLRDSK